MSVRRSTDTNIPYTYHGFKTAYTLYVSVSDMFLMFLYTYSLIFELNEICIRHISNMYTKYIVMKHNNSFSY